MMITLEEKIAKTQRLLRRLEEDQPYLHVRLSALGAEHRQSANAFAGRVRAKFWDTLDAKAGRGGERRHHCFIFQRGFFPVRAVAQNARH